MGFNVMCPVLGMDMLGSWGTRGEGGEEAGTKGGKVWYSYTQGIWRLAELCSNPKMFLFSKYKV